MRAQQTTLPFVARLAKGWNICEFEDLLAEPVRNGIYKKKEFHGSGIKMVNMGELFAFDFLSGQHMRRLELTPVEREKYLLNDGDLLFARRSLILEGSGKCSLVVRPPEPLTFESSIIRARLNKAQADPKFYFYFFRSPTGRALVASIASRTAVSGITGSNLVKLPVLHPPRHVQRKIAAVLSAYDDLIENNTRRIRILEEMAQAIYREWFVHFRFPGHERVKMVDSALGPMPEGWEVSPIGQVVQTLGGSTPSTKNPEFWTGGDMTWFIPTDLTKSGSMFVFDSEKQITRLGLKNSSARLFPPYCVMMTSRATIGVIAINTKEACTNQGFITCIPNDRLSAYHIFFWIKENLEKITSIASGATYKEINRTEFRSLPIAVPGRETAQLFVEMVGPIGEQIETLLAKNANLRQTCDLLLPRLVSGEVDVSELDLLTGEGPDA